MTNFLFIGINFLLILPTTWQQQHQQRKARGVPLIFPPTSPTRTQWIVGIGIPLEDLLFEALTTGYVLKVEYYLPDTVQKLYTRTQLNLHNPGRQFREGNENSYDNTSTSSTLFEQNLVAPNFLRRNAFMELMENSKRVLSNYRWSVYKALEGLANHLGLTGRSCVLKSICETAEIPFHYTNGMLGELMHILLTPSSSADELSEHADNEYFEAEQLGRSGASCQRIFRDCPKSLLEHFSNIHLLRKDLQKIIG